MIAERTFLLISIGTTGHRQKLLSLKVCLQLITERVPGGQEQHFHFLLRLGQACFVGVVLPLHTMSWCKMNSHLLHNVKLQFIFRHNVSFFGRIDCLTLSILSSLAFIPYKYEVQPNKTPLIFKANIDCMF